jgi:tetratricopeptide (TPR) repeat protein
VLAHQGIKSKWLGAGLVCIVVVVFSFWTYERNNVWGDEESLLKDCAAKSPNKTRTHNNLGHALILKGKLDEGISHFSEGLRLFGQKREELIALGKLQKTRIHAHSMLGAEPGLKDLLNRLGLEKFKKGEIQEATAYYQAALRVQPDFSTAHHNLGLALAAQGKFDEAVSHYYQALQMTPDSAKLHNNLANALFKTGKVEESIGHYREALRLKPDYALAYNNLQIALAKQRQGKQALARTQKAPGSEFEDPASNYRFGNSYRSEGNLDKAIEEYKKALSLQPGFIDAMNNLALVYVSRGEYDKALPLYMRMMELQPDSYVAYYNTACLYARKREIEESITWLKRAVNKGFKDWDYLKTDKDLENIRTTSYFKQLTSK